MGIRQGDPVSPYIFIVCAEYLSQYIYFMTNIKRLGIGIWIAKDGPNISYIVCR